MSVDDKTNLFMRVRFLKSTRLLFLISLLMTTGAIAQQAPNDIDYINPYTVSLAESPWPFRTAQGQPMAFRSLTELTTNRPSDQPIEALNLYSNAVRPSDWHRLRQLQKLRLLAIFTPDTMALALDSLLVNLADLPQLEALRISFYHPEPPPRRPQRKTDTTSQKPIYVTPQLPLVPMTGFASLRALRLSGDQLPAGQLLGRFSGHLRLQRVELWSGWERPYKALPDNLRQLPNLTDLLINGRGWQGWERALQGLAGLRSLTLSAIAASGPRARSHDEGSSVLKAYQERYITDLNRGLALLTGLQKLDLTMVAGVERLRLGSLPALTHLRLQSVTPSDSTFWGLVSLEHLSAEDCFMTRLPSSVCDLSRLTTLDLRQQTYTGGGPQTQLPPCLSRLESLTALTISNMPIRQLPLKGGDLPQLRHIILANCELDTFPIFLAQLGGLQYLHLGHNILSSIPDTIRAWGQLDTLILSRNRLTKLPDFVFSLKQLRVLAVDANQLNRLPDQLGELVALRKLSIGDNVLTSLPPSLGQLRQLQSLNIGKNLLTELPRWLGRLVQLTELACDMPLTVLPPSLMKLRELKNLVLRHTRLRYLPSWIGLFKQMTYLRLESDELRNLPESFGRLTELEGLSITGKKLSRLPISLGRLSQLRNLSLTGSNRDEGVSGSGSLIRLPASLVRCKKLYGLIISNQPKLAAVPLFRQLAMLPELGHVDLTADRISTLPHISWETLRWHSLKLGENLLTAPPTELAKLPDLQMLDLRSNPLPELLNRSFHNHTMIQEALLDATQKR